MSVCVGVPILACVRSFVHVRRAHVCVFVLVCAFLRACMPVSGFGCIVYAEVKKALSSAFLV